MSDEVKSVSEVVKSIASLKDEARTLATDLQKNIGEVRQGLQMAQEVNAALRDAGLELRGVLAPTTNNPPHDPE